MNDFSPHSQFGRTGNGTHLALSPDAKLRYTSLARILLPPPVADRGPLLFSYSPVFSYGNESRPLVV